MRPTTPLPPVLLAAFLSIAPALPACLGGGAPGATPRREADPRGDALAVFQQMQAARQAGGATPPRIDRHLQWRVDQIVAGVERNGDEIGAAVKNAADRAADEVGTSARVLMWGTPSIEGVRIPEELTRRSRLAVGIGVFHGEAPLRAAGSPLAVLVLFRDR
jgi:hypothetical protein